MGLAYLGLPERGAKDVLFSRSKGQILTGKRSVHPQPDWWYVGGRMMPGVCVCVCARARARANFGASVALALVTSVICNNIYI